MPVSRLGPGAQVAKRLAQDFTRSSASNPIHCAGPTRDHGALEPVLRHGRRSVNFSLIAGQWNRIGRFYDAFPAGHASASAALQRLNRFRTSNRFHAANREPGRALKTGFRLQYRSEPKLPARVRRGLLEVGQLHALARAVYHGRRGRISARDVHDPMNACSCLTLILACVVYRQAREISRIAAATDFPSDPGLIARFSPIEWKNVILGGEIRIDPARSGIRNPWRAFLYKSGSCPCWREVPVPDRSSPRPALGSPTRFLRRVPLRHRKPTPGAAQEKRAIRRRIALPYASSETNFKSALASSPPLTTLESSRPEQGLN